MPPDRVGPDLPQRAHRRSGVRHYFRAIQRRRTAPDRRVAEVDKLSMGTPLDPPRHSPVRIK